MSQPDYRMQHDITNSVSKSLPLPLISSAIGCHRLMHIEDMDGELARSLDIGAGMDVIIVNPSDGAMRGMALRVQSDGRNWRTFTVRCSRDSGSITELEKRRLAILRGHLYPYYALQAYTNLEETALLGYGIARTSDLIEMIGQGKCEERHTSKEMTGQASFKVVEYDKIVADGRWLYEFKNEEGPS